MIAPETLYLSVPPLLFAERGSPLGSDTGRANIPLSDPKGRGEVNEAYSNRFGIRIHMDGPVHLSTHCLFHSHAHWYFDPRFFHHSPDSGRRHSRETRR